MYLYLRLLGWIYLGKSINLTEAVCYFWHLTRRKERNVRYLSKQIVIRCSVITGIYFLSLVVILRNIIFLWKDEKNLKIISSIRRIVINIFLLIKVIGNLIFVRFIFLWRMSRFQHCGSPYLPTEGFWICNIIDRNRRQRSYPCNSIWSWIIHANVLNHRTCGFRKNRGVRVRSRSTGLCLRFSHM